MDIVSVLIEWLKDKKQLSQMESDLVETFKELTKDPFERPSAALRMGLNYGRYLDVFAEAGIVSGGTAQPDYTLSDEEIRSNLQWQLLKLAEKEQTVLNNVQLT